MADIIDHLLSGVDNVEVGDSSIELGGVVFTMREAALEIALLRVALVRYGEAFRMGTVEPQALQQAIDRAYENTDQHTLESAGKFLKGGK